MLTMNAAIRSPKNFDNYNVRDLKVRKMTETTTRNDSILLKKSNGRELNNLIHEIYEIVGGHYLESYRVVAVVDDAERVGHRRSLFLDFR